MTNVLPPDAQKKVWAMYRARFILVTALVLLGLAAASALTLVPSYVAIRMLAASAQDAAPEFSVERSDVIALERSQHLINAALPLLSSTSSAMSVVEEAIRLRPTGVRISRVTFSAGAEEDRITLIGSGTRGQVSAYRDALTGSGLFSGVAVPVSALVGSNQGGFSIVLTGSF
jgi:hypothetical protein